MPPIDNSWSRRPPPPLPSYPPAAPEPDVSETGRWFLVSLAGRTSMRIRGRFVVGSASSCDLSLVEWGVAPNHALLTVEHGELYITPLSDAATWVDGQILRGRVRLRPDSALSFGELEFAIQFEAPEPLQWAPKSHGPIEPSVDPIEPSVPPLEPVAASTSPRSESRRRQPPRPRPRSRNAAPVSLGIAVPLILFALWFYRADQWPAQFAQNAPPMATPSSAPPSDVASNANGAVGTTPAGTDTAPLAASPNNDVLPQRNEATQPPESETTPMNVAAIDEVAPVTDTMPLNDATPMNDTTSPMQEPAPQVAEALPQVAESTPQPVQTVSDAAEVATLPSEVADAELPREQVETRPEAPLAETVSAELPAEVAILPTPAAATTAPPVETTLARNPDGPPLIFKAQPPLVDIEALASADTRVKPPWSDGPPLVADARATGASTEPVVQVAIPPTPAAVPTAPPVETVLAAHNPDGPPLIFKDKPPLVDIERLASADTGLKPPWSGEARLVVYGHAQMVSRETVSKPAIVPAPAAITVQPIAKPALPIKVARSVFGVPLIFKAKPPLVDVQVLEMADAGVKPPWSDEPPTVADAAAKRAAHARELAALMSEAGRLYSQGDLVVPLRNNAAEFYVRVLSIDPKSRTARTRLNNIVGWVARDASDALAERHPDRARQIIAQLSTAVPKDRRANVDATVMRRWRVVELLVSADALMQKRQIVGPAKPNAVALLREALKIDRHNAIAEQMLARALGGLASAPNR